jgi:hypothetical protein
VQIGCAIDLKIDKVKAVMQVYACMTVLFSYQKVYDIIPPKALAFLEMENEDKKPTICNR